MSSKGVEGEEIKGVAWKISVAAGFLSILFVIFIALLLSRVGVVASAAIAFLVATVYAAYAVLRLKAEKVDGY